MANGPSTITLGPIASGPTIIPDIAEFYLNVQDQLTALKFRIEAIEKSSSPVIDISPIKDLAKGENVDKILGNHLVSSENIPDIAEFYFKVQDEYRKINERVRQLEASFEINGNVVNSTENSLNLQELEGQIGEMRKIMQKQNDKNTADFLKQEKLIQDLGKSQINQQQLMKQLQDNLQWQQSEHEKLKQAHQEYKTEISKHFQILPKNAKENLEWDLFMIEMKPKMEDLVCFRQTSRSPAFSCKILIRNISNTIFKDPAKWSYWKNDREYEKMPQNLSRNAIESFGIFGENLGIYGLFSYKIHGINFVGRYHVSEKGHDFGIGFSSSDVTLDYKAFSAFEKEVWVKPSNIAMEYRRSTRHSDMEATVSFKKYRARAIMTPGKSNRHAILTILISNGS